MSKVDAFIEKVNEYRDEIKWENVLDKSYQNKLTEKLVSFFEEVYNTNYLTWRECQEDEGFAEVPATILGNNGKEYVAILSLCIEDAGEHYGTIILHPKFGFLNQEDFNKKLSEEEIKNIIPYKYRPLITIARDHHEMHQY